MRVLLTSLVAVLLASPGIAATQTVPLTAGMVIGRFVTITPGTYHLPASADLQTSAIAVRGADLTVDCDGAVLPGACGERRFNIEYYEIGGFAELRFNIQRK